MTAQFFGFVANEVLHDLAASPAVPPVLWHYTTSAGLLGIVDTGSLRFAEAIYMNDGSELLYGVSLLQEVLREFETTVPEEQHGIASKVTERVKQTISDFSAIIFCFCNDPNLLNQWRDYGQDVVPYCIGFDAQLLQTPGEYSFDAYLVNVIYDRELQKRILLEAASRMYERAKTIPNFGKLSDEEGEPYLRDAAIQFSTLILRLKNPAFEAEREWRLISHRPEVQRRVKRSFRSSSLGVIPFYDWKPQRRDQRLPITDVIVGPSPHGHISHLALRELLEEYGYRNSVRTDFSTIPIRR